MGRARQLLTAAGLLLIFLSVAGCTSTHVHRDTHPGPAVIATHGPPPHAPAHGYRTRAMDGSIIVFDVSVGCYEVVGWTGIYYHGGHYYRVRDGRWERSMRLDRGWGPPGRAPVPPGLRGKVAKTRPPAKDVRTADKSRSIEASPAQGKGKPDGKSSGKSQGKSKSKGKGKKDKDKDDDDQPGKGKGKGRGKGKGQER